MYTKIFPSFKGEIEQQTHLFVVQAFDLKNSKDSTKISQKSHLGGQWELEQQDHLLVMQAFDF